ncbi:MAG: GNAT family N-acetyltransferase [Blastocatellia bacterium]
MINHKRSTTTVRPATTGDASAIATLARGLLMHEQSLNETMGELAPWAAEAVEIEKQMRRPNTRFFVAENWGEIIGYIKVQSHGLNPTREEIGLARWLLDRLERAARAILHFVLRRPRSNVEAMGGYIAGVFVRLESRRSNVGRMLVEAAEEWLRTRGIETTELHVLCANEEAVRFWKDAGYEPLALGMRKKLESTTRH